MMMSRHGHSASGWFQSTHHAATEIASSPDGSRARKSSGITGQSHSHDTSHHHYNQFEQAVNFSSSCSSSSPSTAASPHVRTPPSCSLSSAASVASISSAAVVRRLSNEDVRSIFECLHGQGPLPPPERNLHFTIVAAGPECQKLSPPPYEYQEGLYVLLRPNKKTKKRKNPRLEPRPPPHLQHLLLNREQLPEASCPWSLSGPQFPQPTALQQRYCYPKGDIDYSSRVGGALWTVYGADGREDTEFRLLHVYFSAKRAVTRGGPVGTSPPTPTAELSRLVHDSPQETATSEEIHSPMRQTSPGRSNSSGNVEAKNWPVVTTHAPVHSPWYGASPTNSDIYYSRGDPRAAVPLYGHHGYPPVNPYQLYYGNHDQHCAPMPRTGWTNFQTDGTEPTSFDRFDQFHENERMTENGDDGFPFRPFHPVVENEPTSFDDVLSCHSSTSTPIRSPPHRQRQEQEFALTPTRSPASLQTGRSNKVHNHSNDSVSPLSSPPVIYPNKRTSNNDKDGELVPMKSFDMDSASFADMIATYDDDCWNETFMPILEGMKMAPSPSPDRDKKSRVGDIDSTDSSQPQVDEPCLTARVEHLQREIHNLIQYAPSFEKESLLSSVSSWADDLVNDPQLECRRRRRRRRHPDDDDSKLDDKPDNQDPGADTPSDDSSTVQKSSSDSHCRQEEGGGGGEEESCDGEHNTVLAL